MESLHPVIQSLLNRRGLSVPVSDNKKISLVLFGGIMSGIGGAAAMIAFEELGLTNAFDNIFVVSAGLPNASYFLSKQAKLGTSIYYEDLSGRRFINIYKFWNPLNTTRVVETIRDIKPLDVEKVIYSSTNIFVRLLNIDTKKAEYLNLGESCKNCKDYFVLLKNSITFSKIFNPSKIDGKRYIDGAMPNRGHIRDHIDYACRQECTDVLIVYPKGEYNLNIGSNKICELTLPLQMSKFETRELILIKEAQKAGLYVKRVFGMDEPITL